MAEYILNPHVRTAYLTLLAKSSVYSALLAYYDGDAPMPVISSRLKDILKGLDVHIAQNWTKVVIDSVTDRISLDGFTVANNETAQMTLHTLFTDLELDLEADDIHTLALVTGEAYMVVWKDDEAGIEAYYNDPRQVHVWYDSANPRLKRWAAKWWDDDAGYRRLTLYYADHIEYYVSTAKSDVLNETATFEPNMEYAVVHGENIVWPDNPYGRVPVFHFRTNRRMIKSDLKDVVPLQNAVNMLFINLLVASEFSALPQKYVISNAEVNGVLTNKPNAIWELPAGDGLGQATSVGQFAAANLDNYLKPMEQIASVIGVLTNTPKHFFFAQGGDPSGEALIALEGPLNKKTKDRVKRFVPVWRDVAAFLLELSGMAVPVQSITPLYAAVETVQPRTNADVTNIWVQMGVPLITALRRSGWTDSEIKTMLDDKAQESASNQTTLAQAMLDAQRRFDQGTLAPAQEGQTHAAF